MRRVFPEAVTGASVGFSFFGSSRRPVVVSVVRVVPECRSLLLLNRASVEVGRRRVTLRRARQAPLVPTATLPLLLPADRANSLRRARQAPSELAATLLLTVAAVALCVPLHLTPREAGAIGVGCNILSGGRWFPVGARAGVRIRCSLHRRLLTLLPTHYPPKVGEA